MKTDEFKSILKECLGELGYENSKATLTIQECAKFTGIGKDKLFQLAHNQRSGFPVFKVGAKFLVNKTMLIEWLNRITLEGEVL